MGFSGAVGSPSLMSSFPLKSLPLRLLGAVGAGDRVESQRKVSSFPPKARRDDVSPVMVRGFLFFCFVLFSQLVTSQGHQGRRTLNRENPSIRLAKTFRHFLD